VSPIDQVAGNRRFPRPPAIKAAELHLNADNPPPVPVFFAQQLKSTLGEALMLVLSAFLRVRIVFALVLHHATAVSLRRRRRTPRAALAPPHAAFARALEPRRPAAAGPHRRRDKRAATSPALRRR